jgi:hypothetical protein
MESVMAKIYLTNKNYLAKIKIIWLTESLFLKYKAFLKNIKLV